MIKIDNVTFHHGKSLVLNEVSLEIGKGGITALIGPNGAGKSTLFALMARLQSLQSGQIIFDGLNIATTSSKQLAKKLAILRQDTHVASRISVRDMVGFGRFPHHQGRASKQDFDKIDEALSEFQLEDVSDRFIDELSGGQRQRVLIAMAYAQDTEYLLLDEPLNNLDMHHSRELMRKLRELADHHGKTIVIVLHDINYASVHADNIVAMKGGTVAAHMKTAEFMSKEILSSVYDMDVVIRDLDGQRIALHHA